VWMDRSGRKWVERQAQSLWAGRMWWRLWYRHRLGRDMGGALLESEEGRTDSGVEARRCVPSVGNWFTSLSKRKRSVKRSTKGVFDALSVTLDWTQEGCPKGMHGPIVTGVMQSCTAHRGADMHCWEPKKAEGGGESGSQDFSLTRSIYI